MNPELLAAYHYLSSAIAQAFAALIALTAMFYIYRRGILKKQLDEVADEGRSLLAQRNARRSGENLENQQRIADSPVNHYRLDSNLAIMDAIRSLANSSGETINLINLWGFSAPIKVIAGACSFKYDRLTSLRKAFITLAIISIVLSALTMTCGILALLCGYKLCMDQRWLVMMGESTIAGVALVFTVIVVIIMLIEPKLYKSSDEAQRELAQSIEKTISDKSNQTPKAR